VAENNQVSGPNIGIACTGVEYRITVGGDLLEAKKKYDFWPDSPIHQLLMGMDEVLVAYTDEDSYRVILKAEYNTYPVKGRVLDNIRRWLTC